MTEETLLVLTKNCKRCHEEKPLDEFGNHARSKDSKSPYCKPCQQLFRQDWRDRNKEKEANSSRAWHIKNIQKVRKLQRDFYHKNPEKAAEKRKRMYEKHKEKRLEYARKTKLENREFYSQLQRLRDAKRSMAFPKWANLEKMNNIYREAKELQLKDGIPRHVDHIIPLQHPLVSGLHCEFNLQILTAQENMKKKNKFDIEAFTSELRDKTP